MRKYREEREKKTKDAFSALDFDDEGAGLARKVPKATGVTSNATKSVVSKPPGQLKPQIGNKPTGSRVPAVAPKQPSTTGPGRGLVANKPSNQKPMGVSGTGMRNPGTISSNQPRPAGHKPVGFKPEEQKRGPA